MDNFTIVHENDVKLRNSRGQYRFHFGADLDLVQGCDVSLARVAVVSQREHKAYSSYDEMVLMAQ